MRSADLIVSGRYLGEEGWELTCLYARWNDLYSWWQDGDGWADFLYSIDVFDPKPGDSAVAMLIAYTTAGNIDAFDAEVYLYFRDGQILLKGGE